MLSYMNSFMFIIFKIYFSFKNIFFKFIFREKGRKGEREGEKRQCVVASRTPPTGDLDHYPGMCPDWESNPQPFGSQVGTQSTQSHQPGLKSFNVTSPASFLLT